MDTASIMSALARFEGLAQKYGPSVVQGVSGLADALGGSEPPASGSVGQAGAPEAPHLAARLHRAADFLNEVLSQVERHTARANVALGTSSGSVQVETARG